ncbi:MAG TPA: uroporphyrinogen-III synthase [Povalibacter sp.]|uniref:uroporphyrinogen-III synthase n=1 Tax=Povalibacter sp. TaxID=1962978 RepID=UPI002D00CBA5|nr:uroporphyrinogen-III synthase [Povalibacter sp.]HMN43506.1 uroporphyrinogen-III synthase [Povalibacter sp.]
MSTQEQTLAGRTIAVPETRELDVFSAMLERRGATVLRCPLVAILDAPDPQPVLEWVRHFNTGTVHDLILLTGEGLRRILRCIDVHAPDHRDEFIRALTKVRKITRGPKPAKALRELGLKPDIAAEVPTTEGVIESLRKAGSLAARSVGVQLYGTEPNLPLVNFLRDAGATVRTVAPYIYADKADDDAVRALLTKMANGEVDVIAFTSTPQVERIFAVGPPELVQQALERTEIAAIGPVVAEALQRHQVTARLMPHDSFFMKPLTSAMADGLGPRT